MFKLVVTYSSQENVTDLSLSLSQRPVCPRRHFIASPYSNSAPHSLTTTAAGSVFPSYTLPQPSLSQDPMGRKLCCNTWLPCWSHTLGKRSSPVEWPLLTLLADDNSCTVIHTAVTWGFRKGCNRWLIPSHCPKRGNIYYCLPTTSNHFFPYIHAYI